LKAFSSSIRVLFRVYPWTYSSFFRGYTSAKTAPHPDETVLRLSDAFEELKSWGLVEKDFPALELIVRVININEGRDNALAVRYEEGWEDGIENGRTEGREERELEIARNLLVKGSTPEFVHEITGLHLDEIEKLQGYH